METPGEIYAKLREPFAPSQMRTVPGTGQREIRYEALLERLDTVLGPTNWSATYGTVDSKCYLCSLTLIVAGEAVTKADTAYFQSGSVDPSETPTSAAFRRACAVHGIGRTTDFGRTNTEPEEKAAKSISVAAPTGSNDDHDWSIPTAGTPGVFKWFASAQQRFQVDVIAKVNQFCRKNGLPLDMNEWSQETVDKVVDWISDVLRKSPIYRGEFD